MLGSSLGDHNKHRSALVQYVVILLWKVCLIWNYSITKKGIIHSGCKLYYRSSVIAGQWKHYGPVELSGLDYYLSSCALVGNMQNISHDT